MYPKVPIFLLSSQPQQQQQQQKNSADFLQGKFVARSIDSSSKQQLNVFSTSTFHLYISSMHFKPQGRVACVAAGPHTRKYSPSAN